ncbi:phenylacetate--CoA ligase family protein [Jejudonia soesokkakensis]|uniref:Phenylacetate--CoA ligase family protein n=1 Tax=Jejudonia soesokkakensis TaxID=1323432 RepID=A0ABW2MVQ7_9FLAO
MKSEIEYTSETEIKAFQEEKLKDMLTYISENSPFYKRMFAGRTIEVSKIKTLQDLQQLPVTTKDDLQQFNDDFLCVPKTKIIDFVTTSGTMGSPVTFALTDKDLDRLAYNEAISMACSGVSEKDTIQLMTTIDRRFMAGLAYFLGARKLGAGIIRVGSGVPELQWDSILQFKPTYLICVPSFLLKLVDFASENDIDVSKTNVKAAICIGEPIRDSSFKLNALGKKIQAVWDIELFSTYASTEMATAFNECSEHQGGHEHPDLIISEILDEHHQPVEAGEVGELAITTLGVEGMPLLRFKTGDMVQAFTKVCGCGRTTKRLGPVVGRKQQMIKYKGTTLYPPAMFNALEELSEIQNFVIELSQNAVGTDEILLKLVVKDPSETSIEKIKNHFRATLRVLPSIELVSEKELQKLQFPKLSRKPVLLHDKR